MNKTRWSVAEISKKAILMRLLALLVGVGAWAPGLAVAQEPDTEDGIEHVIIVSATKRAENIQDVPIAITALSADDVKMSGSQSVQDAAALVPNFEFPTSRYAGDADISIRGIFNNVREFGAGFDVGYGVYLDGVFQGRQNAANVDLGEVERIEVLRGPQGTLFGKNTIAGAINIITKRPGNDFEATLEADIGNWDLFRLRGMINAPIIEGKLAMRLSAFKAQRDGYVTNVTLNDNDVGSYDQWGVRAQIELTPNDSSRFYLSVDALDFEGSTYVLENVTSPGPELSWDTIKYTTHNDFQDTSEKDEIGVALTWEQELGGGYDLTSITAYKDYNNAFMQDGDLRAIGGFNWIHDEDQSQFTQEVRIASPSDRRFDYVAGVYYFNQTIEPQFRWRFEADVFGSLGIIDTDAKFKSEGYAGFLHSNFRFNDVWAIYGGLRYTNEKKSHEKIITSIPSGFATAFGFLEDAPFPIPDIKNDNVSWTAGLRVKPTDNLMFYGGVSTGFKSAGYNISANTLAALDTNLTVDVEKAINYEVGAKTSWLQDRLIANAAFFYIDYTDLQVSVWDPTIGALGGIAFRNAASVTSKGIELELSYWPTERLSISAAIGYTDATFDEFPGVTLPRGVGGFGDANDGILDGRTDAAGNRVPLAPKWNVGSAISYQQPTTFGGTFISRLDVNYKSSRFSDQGAANTPDDFLPAQVLLNARIGYQSEDEKWSVYLWSRNLGNSQKEDESRWYAFLGAASLTKRYIEPRTYGVTLSVKL